MDPRIPQKAEQLRLYHRAVVDVLTFTVEDKLVPTTPGTAQLAHGSAVSRLRAARRNSRIPIPSTAVVQLSVPNDPSRGFSQRRMTVNYTDRAKTVVMTAKPPQAVDIMYSLSVLLATPNQVNEIVEAYWNTFIQDKVSINIKIPEYSTDQGINFTLVGTELKTSSGESAKTGDRIFECTSNLTLKAYIFRPVTLEPALANLVSKFEEY